MHPQTFNPAFNKVAFDALLLILHLAAGTLSF